MQFWNIVYFSLVLWAVNKACDSAWKWWTEWQRKGKMVRRRKGMRWDGPDKWHIEGGDDDGQQTPR
jgi:hypothetical protein